MDMEKIKDFFDNIYARLVPFVKKHPIISLFIALTLWSMIFSTDETKNDDDTKNPNSQEISTVSDENKKVESKNEIERQTGELKALDLSIGKLTIDDPENLVYDVLGQPQSKKTDDNGHVRLKYELLDVVIWQNKISAFVSQDSNLNTPRGIHKGSNLHQILDEYGTNYITSNYENTTLYEYKITSKDGNPCYLRFAIRDADNLVDYISIRYEETKTNEKPSESAEKVLIAFHENITNKNLRQAFNYFSSDFQSSLNFNNWANGFDTTVSSTVSNINVESESADSVTLSYLLTAVDNPGGTNKFNGQVTIIKESDGWKIDNVTNKNINPSTSSYNSNTKNNQSYSSANVKSLNLTVDQFVSRYNDAIAGRTWNGMATISNVQFGANNEAEVKLTENIAITFVKASSDSNELGGIVLAAEHFTNGMSRGEDMTLEEVMRAMISGIAPDVNATAFVNDLTLILIQGGTKQLGDKTLIFKPDGEGGFFIVVLKQ